MLTTLTIILHVIVAMALILIILLQTGKGAGMGAAFGGASQTLFGSTGRATFLTKVTIIAAVVFGFTSMGLSFVWTQPHSVMDTYEPQQQQVPGMPKLPEIPTATGVQEQPGAITPAEEGQGEAAGGEEESETPDALQGLPKLPPASGGEAEKPADQDDTGPPQLDTPTEQGQE